MPEFNAGARPKGLTPFARGYIECALWLAEDEGGPAATWDDIADKTLPELVAQASEFRASFGTLLDEANDAGRNDESLGHDFYLSRNGHGAGFWDRGLGPVGDRLHAAAKAYGEMTLYWGDDGSLYASND